MPSPFPGMNPYLEQAAVWHDFHQTLLPLMREVLTAQVRPGYLVKVEEHLFVHEAPVERHAFLEIRDRDNMELVTVIEMLSPSNKDAGPDREMYLAKRRRLLWSGTHLVEIDLLRGGGRMPPIDIAADYCVFVSRAEERPRAVVWPIHLRNRLPEIPIPLRPAHPDARLDLQQLLHRVYDAAGYEDYIYRHPPNPPLRPDEAEWARQFVPST